MVAVAILVFSGVIVSLKTFYFNQPDQNPKEVAKAYIDNINNDNRDKNKDLVTGEFKQSSFNNSTQSSGTNNSSSSKIVAIFKEESINKDTASVIQEFDATLLKINIEYRMVKEGDWLSGYQWKINNVIFPELGANSSNAKKAEAVNLIEQDQSTSVEITTLNYKIDSFKESKSLKPIGIYDDEPELLSKSGTKFIIIDYTLENTTKKTVTDLTSDFLQLRDQEGRIFNATNLTNRYKFLENDIYYNSVNPNIPTPTTVIFEVPENISSYGTYACKKDTSNCYYTKLK